MIQVIRFSRIATAALLVAILSFAIRLPAEIDKRHWRVIDVSSENVITGEEAALAIDGDPESQWHTQWHTARDTPAAEPPHSITVDLGIPETINAFRVRTRAHGEGGFPESYLLEFSRDGVAWDEGSTGTFSFSSRMTPHAVVNFPSPVSARYFRLTVRSIYESGRSREPGLVIGEIDIATPGSPLVPTTLIPVPQSREWNYGGYHWKSRHRELLRHAQTTRGRLVFIGDSITHRWGAPPADGTPPTGRAVWKRYYAHREALNLGYGWDRIENMLWRIQHGELEATDPRLVVVMAGTNNLEVNSPEEIFLGLQKLCWEIHARKPDATILLLAVFPRGEEVYPPGLIRLNEMINEHDWDDYVRVQDIGSVFLNEEGRLTREIMPDLLHPGEEGYRRWAAAIEDTVSDILGDPEVVPSTVE